MLNKFYRKLCRIWRENQVFQYGSVWKKSVWQTDFQLAGSYLHRPTNALPSHLCQSTPSTVKQCLKFCGSNPCLKRHPSPFPRQRVPAHQNGVKKWCFFLVFDELPAFHFSSFFTTAEVTYFNLHEAKNFLLNFCTFFIHACLYACNWSELHNLNLNLNL